MPRRSLLWLELGERQYLDLPSQLLDRVDVYLAQLVNDPTGDPQVAYDERSDHWSLPIGDQDLLLYAVVADPPTVIIIRLVVE